jgi:hypothetical protein
MILIVIKKIARSVSEHHGDQHIGIYRSQETTEMIRLIIRKIVSDAIVISTWELTVHGIGSNYFLDKMILLVIKNSLTGDPDALEISTWEFTAHGIGWNYFLDKMILLVTKKNIPTRDRTPRRLAHG